MKPRFTSKSIAEVLKEEHLHIPNYQRPYKWTRQQIRNLFYDVNELIDDPKRREAPYHLGTLILHQTGEHFDIVDGQQRLLSISLLLNLLGLLADYPGAKRLLEHPFGPSSIQHTQENTQEWRQLFTAVDPDRTSTLINHLLTKCYLSIIQLPEERLAEAFQLFDSQNNRGKALEPHDLLKAFHLRSIPAEKQTEDLIRNWEELVGDEQLNLTDLFDKHLFRIRHWVNGDTGLTVKNHKSQLRFTSDFLSDFKGVNLAEQSSYPYLQIYHLLEKENLEFPHSLVMPIINGEHFFHYIDTAHQQFITLETEIRERSSEELKTLLQHKDGKYQRNRNLLLNLLALYCDRFGLEQLSREVLETISIWAYYPRTAKRIMDSTVAKYAAGGRFQNKDCQKLFQLLQQASTPTEFLQSINHDYFENHSLSSLMKEIL